jgi:hypothetical protein
MSGMDRALLALWTGSRLSITTPTGNQFDVMKEDGEVILIEKSGGTVTGEQASDRLKTVLRAVGTDWSVSTNGGPNAN